VHSNGEFTQLFQSVAKASLSNRYKPIRFKLACHWLQWVNLFTIYCAL